LLLFPYIYNPFNNLFYIDYVHCVRPSSVGPRVTMFGHPWIIKLFTQAHWSHSQQWILQTCGYIATDSLGLLFTQYKTTCLSAISSHCVAALPAMISSLNSNMRQNACYRNPGPSPGYSSRGAKNQKGGPHF